MIMALTMMAQKVNVTVPQICLSLNESILAQLQLIDVLCDSDEMGTNIYMEVLNVIEQNGN